MNIFPYHFDCTVGVSLVKKMFEIPPFGFMGDDLEDPIMKRFED